MSKQGRAVERSQPSPGRALLTSLGSIILASRIRDSFDEWSTTQSTSSANRFATTNGSGCVSVTPITSRTAPSSSSIARAMGSVRSDCEWATVVFR